MSIVQVRAVQIRWTQEYFQEQDPPVLQECHMPWIAWTCKVQIRGRCMVGAVIKTIEVVLETFQQAAKATQKTLYRRTWIRAVIWTKLATTRWNWKLSHAMKYSRWIIWLKTAKFSWRTRRWTRARNSFTTAETCRAAKFNWTSTITKMTHSSLCSFNKSRRIPFPPGQTGGEVIPRIYLNKEIIQCFRRISSWNEERNLTFNRGWTRPKLICQRRNVVLDLLITILKG